MVPTANSNTILDTKREAEDEELRQPYRVWQLWRRGLETLSTLISSSCSSSANKHRGHTLPLPRDLIWRLSRLRFEPNLDTAYHA